MLRCYVRKNSPNGQRVCEELEKKKDDDDILRKTRHEANVLLLAIIFTASPWRYEAEQQVRNKTMAASITFLEATFHILIIIVPCSSECAWRVGRIPSEGAIHYSQRSEAYK